MLCPKCGHSYQQAIRLNEATRARTITLARLLLLRESDKMTGREFWIEVNKLDGPPSDYLTSRRFLQAIRAYIHDPDFTGSHRWVLKREVLTIVAGGNLAVFEAEGIHP